MLTIYLKRYIIINVRRTRQISTKCWKGEKAVGKKRKKKKKKSIQWKDLTINALIDLIVGIVLIIIDKLIG